MKAPLDRGRRRDRGGDRHAPDVHRRHEEFQHPRADRDPGHAGQARQRTDLQQGDGQNRPRADSQAAADGGGPEILAGEGPGGAEDADAAKHQDHEPREAQVVLAAPDSPGQPLSRLAVGPYPGGRVHQRGAQVVGQPGDHLLVADREQDFAPSPRGVVEQTGLAKIGEIHQHPRSPGKEVNPGPGFPEDVPANLEGLAAEKDPVADLQPQPRSHLGTHQGAPSVQQVRAVRRVVELDRTMQGKRAVHPLHFHHCRAERIVHRPGEGGRLGDPGHAGQGMSGSDFLQQRFHFLGEPVRGAHRHIRRQEEAGLVQESRLQAVGRGAEHDDGGDPDRDGEEEQRKAARRGAQLASGHAEGERHRIAGASGTGGHAEGRIQACEGVQAPASAGARRGEDSRSGSTS